MKNSQLKLALFESGKTQKWLSSETGIPESHLSLAINGRFILTEDQRQNIARVLKRDEKKLFNGEN